MAAFVQEVGLGVTSGNNVTVTLAGITTSVGNHLVLCIGNVYSGDLLGVTDSKGNVWQVDAAFSDIYTSSFIASCHITTALVNGDVITAVLNSGYYHVASVAEYSGVAADDWVDRATGAGSAAVTQNAYDTGALSTTTFADDLLVGMVNMTTYTAPAGFAAEVLSPAWHLNTGQATGGYYASIRPMYRLPGATGAFHAKATWTNNYGWSGLIVAYKPAAAKDLHPYVQRVAAGTNGPNATTLVLTVGATTTAGHHLIMCIGDRYGLAVTGIADSKSNTWQVDVTASDAYTGTAIASCKIATPLVAGDTITVTFSGTGRRNALVDEYVGLATSSWVDQSAGAVSGVTTGGASDSGATATTTNQQDLLVGTTTIQMSSGPNAFFPEAALTPGWNLVGQQGNGAYVSVIRPMYRIVNAKAAYHAKATWTISYTWSAAIVAYKLAPRPTSQAVALA